MLKPCVSFCQHVDHLQPYDLGAGIGTSPGLTSPRHVTPVQNALVWDLTHEGLRWIAYFCGDW